MPAALRAVIASASRPNTSCSTSPVCSPNKGGEWRYSTPVSDSFRGLPTRVTGRVPVAGCGLSIFMPRAATCGSAQVFARDVVTGPTESRQVDSPRRERVALADHLGVDPGAKVIARAGQVARPERAVVRVGDPGEVRIAAPAISELRAVRRRHAQEAIAGGIGRRVSLPHGSDDVPRPVEVQAGDSVGLFDVAEEQVGAGRRAIQHVV